MEKVAGVSSIVVDIGELCRTHNLREEDLPTSLRIILETLRRSVSQRFHLFFFSIVLFETSDLHKIESTLRECRKIRGIRRVLLRVDMLRKIKQYDSKLSHILETVQVSSESITQSRQSHKDPISLITQSRNR